VTADRRRRLSVEEYAAGVEAGDRALLARAITLVESQHPEHRRQAQLLLDRLLVAHAESVRVGISGVPGVGKSTFIESFGLYLIEQGHRVAVLAVDPSSTLSGGSILGDKTRMPVLAAREEAFIRPSPTSGSLGGVGHKTRESILLCEAAGYDVILVETVGVGQSETLVADMVDFFLLLMLAGAGDELQGIKRGIFELADLVAINKADGDNLTAARRARAEYERALSLLRPAGSAGWSPRVLICSGLEAAGLDRIWEAVTEHHQLQRSSGELVQRRRQQQVRWMWSLVEEGLRLAVERHPSLAGELPGIERAVRDGRLAPSAAAQAILRAFGVEDG
jgi:LAO/AO transport system kinase